MNTQKVQTEITNIINELKERIGGKNYRRQYPVAKWQIAELTELGIIDQMPAGFGHSDATAVITAAKEAGRTVGGFNASGEGDEAHIGASALYNAIHEVVEVVAEMTEEEFVEALTNLDAAFKLDAKENGFKPARSRYVQAKRALSATYYAQPAQMEKARAWDESIAKFNAEEAELLEKANGEYD